FASWPPRASVLAAGLGVAAAKRMLRQVAFLGPRQTTLMCPFAVAERTGSAPPVPTLPSPPSLGGGRLSPHTRVPPHAPCRHASPSVHWSPSSHAAPSALVKVHPAVGSQVSVVHTLPSSQVTASPRQLPPAHASRCVQAFPSSHAVPSRIAASCTHCAEGSSHRSAVQEFASAQSRGVPPTQAPWLHVLLSVQKRPSSQAWPSGSSWHVGEQQSPATVLPSSHSSPGSTLPWPQRRISRSTMSTTWVPPPPWCVSRHTTAVCPSGVAAIAGTSSRAVASSGALTATGCPRAPPSA